MKTAAQLISSESEHRPSRVLPQEHPDAIRQKAHSSKTVNQRRYLDAIEQNDIVFGIGPREPVNLPGDGAGRVVSPRKRVTGVILARPAVEAGEKIGFCRDLQER